MKEVLPGTRIISKLILVQKKKAMKYAKQKPLIHGYDDEQ